MVRNMSIERMYETSGSVVRTELACVDKVKSVVMANETLAGTASLSKPNQNENHEIITIRLVGTYVCMM